MRFGQNIFFVLTLFSLIRASEASADEFAFQPRIGFGWTDNAYQAVEQPVSDFYSFVRSNLVWKPQTSSTTQYNFVASYQGHAKAIVNDLLTLRVGGSRPVDWFKSSDWDFNFNFGLKDYVRESPGTTEQSFDTYYANSALVKTLEITPELEISLKPGVELRSPL